MNKEKMLRQKVGEVKSISHVLDASFDSLGRKRQNNMMSMAVLPKGAAAPMGMLLNLWEIGVRATSRCCVRGRNTVFFIPGIVLSYSPKRLCLSSHFCCGEHEREFDPYRTTTVLAM